MKEIPGRRVLQALALCMALAPLASVAQTQPAEAVALSGEEILAALKGRSIATQNARWGQVMLQFKEDGLIYGSAKGGADSGRWRIESGKLCLQWRRWDYEGCGSVRRVGEEYQHLWPNGDVHFVFRP